MCDAPGHSHVDIASETLIETLSDQLCVAVRKELDDEISRMDEADLSRPFGEVMRELGPFMFLRVVDPIRPIVEGALAVPTFEDGTPDRTKVSDVQSVLDELEVPTHKKDWMGDGSMKRMTVAGRVHHLGDMLNEALESNEDLRLEAGVVSQDYEADLFRSVKRILARLGFDWSKVGSDGVTATEIEDFIDDAITALERKARPQQKALPLSTTGTLPGGADA